MFKQTKPPEGIQPGTVYLVGAGPGDPDLITVRGSRLLRAADVVVHDRLVAPDLLNEVRADAEIVNAAKYPGFQSFTQEEINDLLIDRAGQGLSVVRLKGGDPLVYGRGGEEALACAAAGIPCVIVPGISSAHAVPAAVGIPVTHRGVGRSYAVITGQTDPKLGKADLPYDAIAQIDTLIVLMGRSNLTEITSGLIAAGRDAETPAACIEMGWTPQQQVVWATLGTLAESAAAQGIRAPVVTVVGDVVSIGASLTQAAALAEQAQATGSKNDSG